jgi:hypothetical protein
MTGSRTYVSARISPPVFLHSNTITRMECAGDDCGCKRGALIHAPALMLFNPELGEYEQAEMRCVARWAVSGHGHTAGRICGERATHQVADVLLCQHHYSRTREWMNDRDKHDVADAAWHRRKLHEEQMRLDRERAEQQRELTMQQRALDKENAQLRMIQARDLAKQQRELDRGRVLAEEAARAESSVVYYVQRESDGLVKIGTSRTLAKRMGTLKNKYGPLLLIATIGGAHAEETALHRQFRDLRAEGEWFRPELPLLEHVLAVMKEHPVAPDPGLPPIMDHRVIFRAIRKIRREEAGKRRQEYWDEQDRLEAEAADPAA